MSAMEKTSLVLAKILDLALKNGVSHWSLQFSDLELDDGYKTYFFPCIEWLEAEGIIRVDRYSKTLGGVANGTVQNISLTSLGMSILGKEVEINGYHERLSETVGKVSQGKVDFHRIGDTIGGLIGGLIKSVGN
jgi:hypothetical protein